MLTSSDKGTRTVDISRIRDGSVDTVGDLVAVEEPLEIQLRFMEAGSWREQSISITMRTPGDDDKLAIGFLYTEGIVRSADDIDKTGHWGPLTPEGYRNTIKVQLREGVAVDIGSLVRNFYTTSSCGVCGKVSLEALAVQGAHSIGDGLVLHRGLLHAATDKMREMQGLFVETGGIHASALMDENGTIVQIEEDVGRHNALDKLIGSMLVANRLPLSGYAIILSGRASFELMQKAMMAGCPVVAAVGAPSSLAVSCAQEYNMTLVGFLRQNRMNIYAGAQRVIAG